MTVKLIENDHMLRVKGQSVLLTTDCELVFLDLACYLVHHLIFLSIVSMTPLYVVLN
jgi:hypothetical protein